MTLKNYFDSIIYVENNTDNLQRKVVLPDNSISMMFQIGERVLEKSNNTLSILGLSVVCGQLTKAKEYFCPPGSKTILVKFKPWSAGFFISSGLHELNDQTNTISCVSQEERIVQIGEQFNSGADKAKMIYDFMLSQFVPTTIDKSIFQALEIIEERRGVVKVEELAYKVCNSKRNFERKFKLVIGLSPKKFISNARFKNCLQFLHQKKDLKDIAYDCGFYDQSHFSNEFKFITGITPEDISLKLCRIFPTESVFMTSSLRFNGLSF